MTTLPRGLSPSATSLAITIVYPFLVYGALRFLSPSAVAVCLALFIALRLALAIMNKSSAIGAAEIWLVALTGGAALLWAVLSPIAGVKAYPVFVSAGFAALFGYSLLVPPTVVERIARLQGVTETPGLTAYLRRVTLAWLIFFLCNGTLSVLTALSGNLELWTLYNGLISYLLIGAMFAGEFLVRRIVQARLQSAP